MNTQKIWRQEGADVVVATPGRLYDLALCRALQLKGIKKVVIDEVDVMLDLGFRFQLTNIFELLPTKKQKSHRIDPPSTQFPLSMPCLICQDLHKIRND